MMQNESKWHLDHNVTIEPAVVVVTSPTRLGSYITPTPSPSTVIYRYVFHQNTYIFLYLFNPITILVFSQVLPPLQAEPVWA
jgi:hypothetical protein